MKRQLMNLNVASRTVNARHVQIVLTLIALGLFVVGAGAPAAVGGH